MSESPPPPFKRSLKDRWTALKRWQRWTAAAVGAVIVVAIIGAAVGGEDKPSTPDSDAEGRALIDETTRGRTVAPPAAETPQPTAAERRAEALRQRQEDARLRRQAAQQAEARRRTQARERARRERALRGTRVDGVGARVITVNADSDGPFVVEASHNGGSNFVVQLVGQGAEELLVNEIGSYSGTVVAQDVASGRYRMRVEADGSWSVRYRQPRPLGGEPSILRSFRGSGSAVIATQTPEDIEPIVSARNTGDSNFVVRLLGYGGEVTGSELLFNDIGPYTGETLSRIPAGDYLLAVEAAGSWSVRFRR